MVSFRPHQTSFFCWVNISGLLLYFFLCNAHCQLSSFAMPVSSQILYCSHLHGKIVVVQLRILTNLGNETWFLHDKTIQKGKFINWPPKNLDSWNCVLLIVINIPFYAANDWKFSRPTNCLMKFKKRRPAIEPNGNNIWIPRTVRWFINEPLRRHIGWSNGPLIMKLDVN